MTTDEIRSKLVALYEESKPSLREYQKYCEAACALTEQFHRNRIQDAFPEVGVQEAVMVAAVDIRETPASLDAKLAQLKGQSLTLKNIIYDRVKHQIYLFA